MKRILLLLICCTIGCSTSTPLEPKPVPEITLPPLYAKGDIVAVRDGNTVGIVTGVNSSDARNPPLKWSYEVMFRSKTLNYSQEDLKLVERFNWDKYKPKAEITLEDNILK